MHGIKNQNLAKLALVFIITVLMISLSALQAFHHHDSEEDSLGCLWYNLAMANFVSLILSVYFVQVQSHGKTNALNLPEPRIACIYRLPGLLNLPPPPSL